MVNKNILILDKQMEAQLKKPEESQLSVSELLKHATHYNKVK